MHDCREMQDSLIDLLFDETDAASRTRLRAEVGRCAACAAQYRSFAATLDACDEASAALSPGDNYWPQYHAALTRRLHVAARDAQGGGRTSQPPIPPSRTPFWKRLLTTSIRVPAPLAAAAALVLIAACALALALVARPAPEPVFVAAPAAGRPEVAPQIKFIEVPVVREKTVTQIIYAPRRADETRRVAPRENLAGVGRRNAPPPPVANMPTARPNLSGFKPAEEVNLRIIKDGDAHEQ
ncbi:MAG TPA: hypothetical protein VEZ40_15050 [Pyrinomonadaceae bacterium]|nr:hypothetical protein [Pyrinomonadaceae bacterium]